MFYGAARERYKHQSSLADAEPALAGSDRVISLYFNKKIFLLMLLSALASNMIAKESLYDSLQ